MARPRSGGARCCERRTQVADALIAAILPAANTRRVRRDHHRRRNDLYAGAGPAHGLVNRTCKGRAGGLAGELPIEGIAGATVVGTSAIAAEKSGTSTRWPLQTYLRNSPTNFGTSGALRSCRRASERRSRAEHRSRQRRSIWQETKCELCHTLRWFLEPFSMGGVAVTGAASTHRHFS
jgi:hypothetical protein